MKLVLLLILTSNVNSLHNNLIESDAGEINNILNHVRIQKKWFMRNIVRISNITNNTSETNSLYLISILPAIGISGFSAKIYSNNLIPNEPYFINVCNKTIATTCDISCKYIQFILPDNEQGICSISISNSNSLNFTYTIATDEIKVKLYIDLDLNNQTEINNFRQYFKQSVVLTLPSIINENQVYICDTCIYQVNNRRLMENSIEVSFRLVSLLPVNNNEISTWKIQMNNNIIQKLNNLMLNLQNITGKNVDINIQNNSSQVTGNQYTYFYIFDVLPIPVFIFICMLLLLLIFSILLAMKNRKKLCFKDERSEPIVSVPPTKSTIYNEGTDDEIIVHEINI